MRRNPSREQAILLWRKSLHAMDTADIASRNNEFDIEQFCSTVEIKNCIKALSTVVVVAYVYSLNGQVSKRVKSGLLIALVSGTFVCMRLAFGDFTSERYKRHVAQ